jgi:hypothetical protein
MQWLKPGVVLRAIKEARSARFESGETPKVIDLRLAAASKQAETPF